MEEKTKKRHSLRWQMVGMVLICWLIPVALVLGVMGWYISDTLSQRAAENLADQLDLNLSMCSDRVLSAIAESRTASTNSTIKDAWNEYQMTGLYSDIYQPAQRFLERQYCADSRFLYASLEFRDYLKSPGDMHAFAYNQRLGMAYQDRNNYWLNDSAAVLEMAEGLDTSIGFLVRGEHIFVVRNIMDGNYKPFAVLTLALNPDYYFKNLESIPWASAVAVRLNDTEYIIKGENLPENWAALTAPGDLTLGRGEPNFVWQNVTELAYELSIGARVDYTVLLSQMSGYKYMLLGLGIFFLPLLLIALNFFNRKISRPIGAMMVAAGEIEQGKLGHQLTYQANSREFQYLTDSFNHMSGQLENQFDRLYQEELALRDARIKALQSHINPHFLNNTLEIINWEARMNGDARVSKMIEALSTVLDAAIARDKRPEVSLAEEMNYVNAYLHIITERFGKRVTILKEIDDATLGCTVPRLILQPVIENAVEHGIGPGGKGRIIIRSYLEGNTLVLETINDGAISPMDREHIDKLLAPDYDSAKETAGNIGISNVNLRLRILHGSDSGLSIHKLGEDQVVARLTVVQKQDS